MHRVTDGLLTNEFASGRGAIHFHSILSVEQQHLKLIQIENDIEDGNTTKIPHLRYENDASVSSTSEISLHFLNTYIALHNLTTKLDHYITTFHQSTEIFPRCPSLLNRKENGLDERESCC